MTYSVFSGALNPVQPINQSIDWSCVDALRVRCFSVSVAALRAAPRYRLLPHSGLRADDAHRDPVVGVVLDQHRRESGARLARPADRADDDDDEWRRARVSAASVLHQSDRRLDDHLSRLRLRLAHRVRRRQRHRSSPDRRREAATAAARHLPHAQRTTSRWAVASASWHTAGIQHGRHTGIARGAE